MSYVFVVNHNKQPINPCHPAEARILLDQGKAAVLRRYPFVIILREPSYLDVRLLRLKIDPGSKVTGFAVVDDNTGNVLFGAHLNHRGHYVHELLLIRRAVRRSRRKRATRYRAPRFDNRTRPLGWLPPSLESRIANIITLVKRIMHYSPISAISYELVRFDTQLMQNPEISGIQYQQGTLQGYEVREYVLEKFGRRCAYCEAQNIPLEIEHIVPLSRGGSNRLSNLTLACRPCNQNKGSKTAEEFGHPHIMLQAEKPLKDAAAMNAMRWKIYNYLTTLGLPIETGTGGRTKYNRTQLNVPKEHYIDAACVGTSTPSRLNFKHVRPLIITATGHGSRQMCKMDKFGFPRSKAKEGKKFFGFQTGDIVQAVVTKGKKSGRYDGKVAIRASGFFNITLEDKTAQGINYKFCKRVHTSDGYRYNFLGASSALKGTVSAPLGDVE